MGVKLGRWHCGRKGSWGCLRTGYWGKYLGTALTDQNCIAEEIKSRLKSGNVCCHSVQNLLSSRLLSKNLKIKIYRTVILSVVLYGCETWSLTLWEERKLRVFENRTWCWGKYLGTALTDQNCIAEEIKSRLKSGNACYHSVQNLLSSRLLSKNLKIKIFSLFIQCPPPPTCPGGLRGPPSCARQKCNRLLRLGRPWGAVTLSRWCEWWYRRM